MTVLRIGLAALLGAWLGSLPVAQACIGRVLPASGTALVLASVKASGGQTSEVDQWAESGTWVEGAQYGRATIELADGTSLHVVFQ